MAGGLATAFDGAGTGRVGVGCVHGLLLVFLLLHHWRAAVFFLNINKSSIIILPDTLCFVQSMQNKAVQIKHRHLHILNLP